MIIIVNERGTNTATRVAQTRVALGKAFLDTKFPGWRARASAQPYALDVSSSELCPLALAYGTTFCNAAEDLGLSAEQTIEFGFCADPDASPADLNTEWLGVLLVNSGWERR